MDWLCDLDVKVYVEHGEEYGIVATLTSEAKIEANNFIRALGTISAQTANCTSLFTRSLLPATRTHSKDSQWSIALRSWKDDSTASTT